MTLNPLNPHPLHTDALGGPDQVAELTGRTLRRTEDGKYRAVSISQRTHEEQRQAFMQGRKSVAVISEAASVGISLHADNREPSRHKRRVHFVLEMAWGADRVMQQLGRSHRSNQASGAWAVCMTVCRIAWH